MKKSLLILMLTLAGLSVLAKPVEPETAVRVARNFALSQLTEKQRAQLGKESFADAHIVYTHTMPKSDKAAMYVVNLGSAFVIVSADDVAHPVLGYSMSRPWPAKQALPSQITSFLDDLASQIAAATTSPAPKDASSGQKDIATEWQQLTASAKISILNSQLSIPDSVGPLLTTTWDQGQYYNALCPEDAAGPAGHVYTGCVATAMAQIINYWGYPVHGRGIHSYETNYGTLTVNYDSASYDYAHMPSALTATSTPQEVNAVATLMHDCGVAANMGYGPNESSSYDVDARAGMINFFRFSPDLSYAEKASFTNAEWENMLRTDIAANRPVMYSGHGDNGGHSFVCDGYKQNGYFHFNFGWSGYADGWFLTSATMGYTSAQTALLGIIPDSTGNVILGQMAGTSTFIVEEPLEFYHLLGHNAFHGMDFSQSFESTTNIIFADTSIPIVANLVNYGGDQSARVYYGDENDYYMIYPTMNWFPIIESFNGTFSINYTGNWHYAGFCLQISKQDTCGILSYFDISSKTDTSQVVLSWLDRGNGSEWIIEYGEEGFEHGNGTTLSSNTNNITINNLLPLTYYDFYIKPFCSNGWTGPISMKTELSYWQDYVSEQPEGIEYNDDGYALVSTPEQLAWLVRENSNCEKILIVADIDLSGHRWKPVNGYPYYQGKEIDGNNHHISNLLVREDKYSLFNYIGFYGYLYPAYSMVFRDIIFDNPKIISERSVTRCGVLAGELRPVSSGEFTYTILNCGVNGGNINCSAFSAGGLIGGFEGNILNSYANISIYNAYRNPHTGGLVADMYGGRIINCYSASEIEYTPYSCAEGQIIGSIEKGKVNNVYGKTSPYVLFFNQYGDVSDTASFGNDNNLFTGVDYDDSVYYDLCTVLNKHVQSRNDSTWRTWQYDSIQGYPILNGSYHVTCTNVSGLRGSNVMHDGLNAIRLDWEGNSSNSYIVKCINVTNFTDSVRYFNVNTNPCFVSGLNQGSKYEIYVKCNCDSLQSGWGESVTILFDKPYWTDIVTTQPAGYMEDVDGNVTISSAEGLAWFASRVNGLNGNESFNFRNKNVSLISDVDLGQYKWMPIGFSQVNFFNVPDATEFQGVFNGNRHTISNLYINEDADKVGFFGTLFQAKVVNVVIENSYVKGLIHVGGLCGIYGNSSTSWNEFNYGNTLFDNCHIIQSDISGKSRVGGLCGLVQPDINDMIIRNCSSTGSVSGITEFGGLIGFIAQNSNKNIENSFSSSNVFCNDSNDYGSGYYGGLIGYAVNTSITNCYTAGIIDTLIIGEYTGSMIGVLDNSRLNYMYGILNTIYNPYTPWGVYSVQNTTMFSMNENHYVFQTPITIENTTYTDLLSALNAWVDANDAEGVYRHWAVDSTGENGGYPVFAHVPCVPVVNRDSITVCDNYSWHGTVYTVDTILTETLNTMDGCDSIISHHLTINHGITKTDTASAIDSYIWADSTYTTSGIYQRTWSSANSCDSTVTLWLTITQTVHDTTYVPDTTLTPVIVYDTTLRDTLVYNLIPHDSIVYTLIPQDSIVYTLIPRDSVVYTLIPKDSIVYTLIPRDSITYTLIPRDSIVYTLIPKDSIVYTLIPQDSIVYDFTYRDTTVYNITNVDTTVYNITHMDTTIYIPTYIDTAIYNIVNVDTTIFVPTYVDTTVYNVTNVDTTVYNVTIVDTVVVDSTLVPVVDTLWLHDTIHYSIFVHDTIVIHDTIVVGIDDIETIDAKIYSSNRQIVVEGAGSNTVRLYDINGRILATKQDDYAPLRFDVHASGTYMIKIGNHPARKVVVIR